MIETNIVIKLLLRYIPHHLFFALESSAFRIIQNSGAVLSSSPLSQGFVPTLQISDDGIHLTVPVRLHRLTVPSIDSMTLVNLPKNFVARCHLFLGEFGLKSSVRTLRVL